MRVLKSKFAGQVLWSHSVTGMLAACFVRPVAFNHINTYLRMLVYVFLFHAHLRPRRGKEIMKRTVPTRVNSDK